MKQKKKILIILTVCLLFTSIIGHAKTGSSVVIENIKVVIVNSENQIRNPELKSKKGHVFSQNTFDQDLRTLSAKYDGVDPEIILNEGTASITIFVKERPRLHAIIIEGNNKISESHILKELDLTINEEFDETKFLDKLNDLKLHYLKKGFFESVITYEIIEQPNSSVDLLVKISEGRNEKIHKIKISGVTGAEEKEILETMVTKKHSVFTGWLTGSGIYHQEAIEQDTLIITNLFQNKGYADAQVNIFLDDSNNLSQTTLIIDIDKGPIYKVGHVHIEGNSVFTKEELSKCLLLSPGSLYSSDNIWLAAKNMQNLYEKRGYMNASVNVKFCLHENEPIYDILYCIEESSPYKIGLIKILGNTKTKQKVILHESLIAPGDCFDSIRLQATETRLKNTGFFKTVNVYTVRSQLDPLNENEEYRDVFIEVGETSTGSIGLFCGFSSLNRLFGGLEFSEQNFNLAGLGSLLYKGPRSLRGGGEYIHLKANIGEKITEYSFQWNKPYFWDTKWILGVDFDKSLNKAISSQYRIHSLGGNVSATYICSMFSKYGIYYRGSHSKLSLKKDFGSAVVSNPDQPILNPSENKDISDKEINPKLDIEDNRNLIKNSFKLNANIETAKTTTIEFSDIKELTEASGPNVQDNNGFVSAIGTTFSFDSTNHPRNPSKGLRSKLSFELAGLGGKYYFVKVGCFGSLYRRLVKQVVLKIKSEIQFIEPYNHSTPETIPLSERFFLGGETTIRGYKPFCIGPKYTSDQPTGGISSFLISEEIQYPLIKHPSVNMFCFVDSGYVSMKKFHFSTNIATSAGFGVRFEFMQNLPMMMGLGWPIRPNEIVNGKKINQSQRFFFALGGLF